MKRRNPRIIVVKNVDSIFTPVGQRTYEMQCNAIVFKDVWKHIKNVKPKYIQDKLHEIFKNNESYYWRIGITINIFDDMYTKVLKEPKNIRVLKIIDKFTKDGDILFATESEVKESLIDYITNSTSITSKKYLKKLLYSTHSALFNIGRECKYEEGKIITTPVVIGERPLMNNGNPMTATTKKAILDTFKGFAKQRQGKYKVVTKYKLKNNKNKNVIEKVDTLTKHSLPVSVAVVIYIIIDLFQDLLVNITRINDTKRLINQANLILLYMFTLYEGCRTTEIVQETTHNNLYFSLGQEYKLLCLAFVKPETLKYLLENDHITKYICEFYKGKDKQHYRGRFLSLIPTPYNMIDLATIYVILMRIILVLDPTAITKPLFKQNVNFSDLRSRINKRLGITGMCMYSIRYAAAEEELKYNIPANWTRYRMGHSEYSNIKDKYANNLNQRILIDNVMTLLGSDVVDTPTNESIPLRLMQLTGAITHQNIPEDIPESFIQELNEIKKGVSLFLSDETDDNSITNFAELQQKIPKNKEELLDELRKIPIGTYISLKEELLTPTMKSEMDFNIDILKSFFAPVSKPNKIPMIWSYPQIMYGIWRECDKEEAHKKWNDLKTTQLLMDIRQLIDNVQGNHTTSANATIGHQLVDDDDDDMSEDEGVFSASKIERGDIVVILCPDNQIDYSSIKLPKTEKYIWVCHVKSVCLKKRKNKQPKLDFGPVRNSYSVRGNFYKGTINNLVYSSVDCVEIVDIDILNVLSAKHIINPKTFQFEKDEIDDIYQNME